MSERLSLIPDLTGPGMSPAMSKVFVEAAQELADGATEEAVKRGMHVRSIVEERMAKALASAYQLGHADGTREGAASGPRVARLVLARVRTILDAQERQILQDIGGK